ncbi:hypothetical protein BC831DRAFT_441542 [Entophlyctis helioformis]|nr:hypothetical protein BC831DRAFT_441542 [Entophlyctis helioformis]
MYLQALCYFELDDFATAESLLRQLLDMRPSKAACDAEGSACPPRPVTPVASWHAAVGLCLDWSSVYCLLGSVCRRAYRLDPAIHAFKLAAELDPFNWVAYKNLCEMGSHMKASEFFDKGRLAKAWEDAICPQFQPAGSGKSVAARCQELVRASSADESSGLPAKLKDATSYAGTRQSKITDAKSEAASANASGGRRVASRTDSGLASVSKAGSSMLRPLGSAVRKRTHDGQIASHSSAVIPPALLEKAVSRIHDVFYKIGSAYSYMAMFNCKPALTWLRYLPSAHRETAYVYALMAHAHFETSDYKLAAQYYERARQMEPGRVEGMDLYATCLWHLKKPVELSSLGMELQDANRLAPQTWCAIGNYYSLVERHSDAIVAFKRAIQLDPYFEYAHTLLGHEYLATESLEQALKCYRTAMSINKRHYNALFGIANVCSKKEEIQSALYHIGEAININPHNAVLLTFAGVMLKRDKSRLEDALRFFDSAIRLGPDNTTPSKMEKADVLYELARYQEALDVLETIPKPVSLVYMNMGKIYKAMGPSKRKNALDAFIMAQDLRPDRSSSDIKKEIDSVLLNMDGIGVSDPYLSES